MSDQLEQYRFSGTKNLSIAKFDTSDTGKFSDREEAVDEFIDNLRKINKLQQKLYAARKEGLIFVFQAMDAAGKDGVIRTVFSTLTPHGVKEYCFKVPSSEEASHDYLWRFWSALPSKGNISIFNRSYYEDVLVGKVHELYKNQAWPDRLKDIDVISQRYSQIRDFEKYLFNTGTRVVKIFLNVSRDEQARRFISRIDTPKKNWKISSGDISEREYWDDYMKAFEKMINTTSTKDSPWYVVPADHKWYCRLIVSRIVLSTLEEMDPQYPEIGPEELENVMALRQSLADSIEDKDAESAECGEVFSKTDAIAADIVLDEEQEKITKDKEMIKRSGFRAVRSMLAQGYILKSPSDIVEAVANAEETDESVDELPEAETGAEETVFVADTVQEDDEREELLSRAYEYFDIGHAKKLSDDQKELLRMIDALESDGEMTDFYTIGVNLDMRPSTLEKLVIEAMADGLLGMDENNEVFITGSGRKSLFSTKKTKKADKKFRTFLKTLSRDELTEFLSMCDALSEEQETAAAEDHAELTEFLSMCDALSEEQETAAAEDHSETEEKPAEENEAAAASDEEIKE